MFSFWLGFPYWSNFGGLAPKSYFQHFGFPKGTSLRQTTSFELSYVKVHFELNKVQERNIQNTTYPLSLLHLEGPDVEAISTANWLSKMCRNCGVLDRRPPECELEDYVYTP